jgi:hypothetical protein
MRVLRDIKLIADHGIRALVTQRLAELSGGEACVPNDITSFVLIEPGDDMAQLEAETGCWLLTTPFDEEVRYGDPDYAPACEWVAEHANCYELAFVLTDSFTQVLLVPKANGIDTQLLQFCAEFAEPSA